METRAFDLSVSTYGEVRQHEYEVVILPWGATEPHNLHLPYWTDSILAHDISVAAAKKAYDDDGVLAMVMPPVGFGAQNPGQRELPFCIHTRQSTQEALLNDIVASLHHQGFRRLLIVNGHGGNQFKGMIRDLNVAFPDMMIASSEWYRQVNAKDYFEHPGDHADDVFPSGVGPSGGCRSRGRAPVPSAGIARRQRLDATRLESCHQRYGHRKPDGIDRRERKTFCEGNDCCLCQIPSRICSNE